ncbi:MAG: N-6 DNA methylase [Alphaproteobacteria bacterium]|uniref:Eco57I restriction-modification methylase domain-containing protein n=1 Tax=Brevundimonas sp. TaxID=1871086 RepID=UPI001DF565E6|nr:N-6 DNA methylase [Alphaproteobacteria bacterium]MBU1520535.1 N-6 DNA methylase [Alphaproteobacteria bacterium]MBU2028974.1 N-6 DNA methylase [Alphaproteobacteria bacterium]MBU2165259.1 N-6 DNA methylase [Alphaproteobacteria bacterium]MBU2231714.1 N-6 DNA methylase [Alphaproteobacteria bacterium]
MDEATTLGFGKLKARAARWVNEEEVRIGWTSTLEGVLNVHFDAERSRKDSSYNNVIIEYKAPGLFGGSTNSPAFCEAMDDRLTKYIKKAAKAEGLAEEEYIGVAIDGAHVAFAQLRGGKIEHQGLIPFGEASFSMVVEACRANYRRAITAENLSADFGHASPRGIAAMQALADALKIGLEDTGNRKIRMLFEEWATLYGQAADLGVLQTNDLSASLGFDFKGPKKLKIAASLFVIHTFNSLLIKLLTAEIVAAHGMASSASLVHELVGLPGPDLFRRLQADVEESGYFDAVGLHGFVEEAIFSWYLDAAANSPHSARELHASFRDLLAQLAIYRFDSITHSARSRDVLRDFYEDIVPAQLRKSLGEFYTPDWLAEHSADQAELTEAGWLKARVLDPTCGSGTFLLEIIRRKLAAAKAAGLSQADTLNAVLGTVWGFDLNPLAVQTARANFLMAVSDLLRNAKGLEVEIPILLADAVYSPAHDPASGEDVVHYVIGAKDTDLDITLPAELVRDRKLLDNLFESLSESIEEDRSYDKAARALVASEIIDGVREKKWRSALKPTYDQILGLHRQQWNGIWLRIIRNFFWSATAGKFDLVIGNPPWVRWSNLPEEYRSRAKPTCERYGIFSDNKFYGGNELDISAMITYTAADKWLNDGGRLIFLITQTVFQAPSSQGFRRFKLPDGSTIAPIKVEDLKALKPFPDAANKTALAVMVKSAKAKAVFPVPYRLWTGIAKRAADGSIRHGSDGEVLRSRTINPRASKAEVLKDMGFLAWEANPASDSETGAPWSIMAPGRFATAKALFGRSSWVQGRKGITTDLNGVFFVTVSDVNKADGLVKVTTRPQEGKTALGPPRSFWIEAELLYPLVKGAGDFKAGYFAPPEQVFAIIPNHGIRGADYDTARTAMSKGALKRTKDYFGAFRSKLEARSTYRGRMKGAPFFAIYNVGDYSFAPYKVIWPEMASNFKAAVATAANVPTIGKRPYVPDHKVFFVEFDKPAPAYYLCGILNAPTVRAAIESHIVSVQIGDVFKHINPPPFDANHKDHLELARLMKDAQGLRSEARRSVTLTKAEALAEKILVATLAKRRASTGKAQKT